MDASEGAFCWVQKNFPVDSVLMSRLTLLAVVPSLAYALIAAPPVERIAFGGRTLAITQEPVASIDSGAMIWDSGRVLSSLIQQETNLHGSTVLEVRPV